MVCDKTHIAASRILDAPPPHNAADGNYLTLKFEKCNGFRASYLPILALREGSSINVEVHGLV
jgi:hypothetical protein